MRPIYYSTNLSASDDDGICASQSPTTLGGGNLTINGALATAGVATLDTAGNARQVLVTTGSNESAKTLTIYGRLTLGGNIVSETMVGPNATTGTTTNFFVTITQIAYDIPLTGTIYVGTNGVGASPWKPLDWRPDPFNVGIGTILSAGAVNWTVQHTFDDIQDPDVKPTAFPHATIAAVSANADGNYAFGCQAMRTKINSGTGTVATRIIQAG